MANKLTKKDYFRTIIGIVEDSNTPNKAPILDFLNHEIELLEKKSSKSKATKAQRTHGAIMAAIKEVLEEAPKSMTITELMTDSRLANYKDDETTVTMTNQKLSALMKKLVDAGEVDKTYEKKKAYFSLHVED